MISAVAVGIAGVILSMAVNYGMVFQMVETAIATEARASPGPRPGLRRNPACAPAARRRPRRPGTARPSGGDGLGAARAQPRAASSRPRQRRRARRGIDPAKEAHRLPTWPAHQAGTYLEGRTDRRSGVLIGATSPTACTCGIGDKVVLSGTTPPAIHGAGRPSASPAASARRRSSLDRSTVYMRLDESQQIFVRPASAISRARRGRRDRRLPPSRRTWPRALGPRASTRRAGRSSPALSSASRSSTDGLGSSSTPRCSSDGLGHRQRPADGGLRAHPRDRRAHGHRHAAALAAWG